MEDMLCCPYDLQYCPEAINAYNRFGAELKKLRETRSTLLVFEPGGFSTGFPPCSDLTMATGIRYQIYLRSHPNVKQH